MPEPETTSPAVPVPGLRDQIAGAVRHAACNGDCDSTEEDCTRQRIQPVVWHHGVLAEVSGTPEQIADAVLAVVQPVINKAQQRAEAMERAMEDTAADALKHRGCHRSLMGQVQRAETAEAALTRVRDRCQEVRDRVGPGGMINASQILGLLSPTWPDGNYEAALTPPADQPESGAK